MGKLLLEVDVTSDAVNGWIKAGWLIQHHNGTNRSLSDVDLARAHLIHDLELMGVNEEAIPIILDLIDQLYGLRGALRTLLSEMSVTSSERH